MSYIIDPETDSPMIFFPGNKRDERMLENIRKRITDGEAFEIIHVDMSNKTTTVKQEK